MGPPLCRSLCHIACSGFLSLSACLSAHSPITHTDPPYPQNPPTTRIMWPFFHFLVFYTIQCIYFLKAGDTHNSLTHSDPPYPRIGIKDWDQGSGSRIGIKDRDQGSGSMIGIKDRDQGSGSRIGIKDRDQGSGSRID